jgi:hypothetical protein
MIDAGYVISQYFNDGSRTKRNGGVNTADLGKPRGQVKLPAQYSQIHDQQRDEDPESACRAQTNANDYAKYCVHLYLMSEMSDT